MAVDWNEDPEFTPPVIDVVEIRTIEQALAWGDGVVEDHRMERRSLLRQLHALADKLFWAEHEAEMLKFELALVRAQAKAGELEEATA